MITDDTGQTPTPHQRPSAADTVVLSPHLDDAVLAMGALIARLTAEGRLVEIWTVFTEGPEGTRLPAWQRRFGDYTTRIAEDDRALRHLSAKAHRLGLKERIWREPRIHSMIDLFHSPSSLNGLHEHTVLSQALRRLLLNTNVHLYAPLGIGHHIDHLEVAVGALEAVIETEALDRVTFYEDIYALGERFRRRHPISRQREWSWAQSPGWASPVAGALLRVAALVPRGPSIDFYVPELLKVRWRQQPIRSECYLDVKLRAISEYKSQISLIGAHRLSRIIRHADHVRGGELYWQPYFL